MSDREMLELAEQAAALLWVMAMVGGAGTILYLIFKK